MQTVKKHAYRPRRSTPAAAMPETAKCSRRVTAHGRADETRKPNTKKADSKMHVTRKNPLPSVNQHIPAKTHKLFRIDDNAAILYRGDMPQMQEDAINNKKFTKKFNIITIMVLMCICTPPKVCL